MNRGKVLSSLPSVDELLNHTMILEILSLAGRPIVLEKIRYHINRQREMILSMDEKDLESYTIDVKSIVEDIVYDCHRFMKMNLKEVINGTGVVLHTNLGRSLLSESIKEDLWAVAAGYSTLEIDVATGKRGSRYSHVTELIKFITKAEDAIVVNNNAAAVMLVLSTVAKNKEVVVSRGELVEIGGSFRVPDVMEQSGAKLVEVGTTNKTHLWDYEKTIGEHTGAFLKVHTSNYKIMGFTEQVPLKELVTLGVRNNIPIIEDLGSGVLIDLSKYGLSHEPTVQESVEAGVDIVTFSGDKLLGGPQAGIIVGKKHWINEMKKNPLTRAFRIDKLTMVALEATLRIYLNEQRAIEEIPTLKMLTEPEHIIKERGRKLYHTIVEEQLDITVELAKDYSEVGGGSLPLEKLPTWVVTIVPHHISVSQLEKRLRGYRIPIFTRIQDDKLIMDLRTIKDGQKDIIVEALIEAVK